MDILFVLGELLALAALGYGAWLCFLHVGEYNEESLRADMAASRGERTRGHSETIVEYQSMDQAHEKSIGLTTSP